MTVAKTRMKAYQIGGLALLVSLAGAFDQFPVAADFRDIIRTGVVLDKSGKVGLH